MALREAALAPPVLEFVALDLRRRAIARRRGPFFECRVTAGFFFGAVCGGASAKAGAAIAKARMRSGE